MLDVRPIDSAPGRSGLRGHRGPLTDAKGDAPMGSEMTPRERVLRAISFEGPDRIPVHRYIFPGAFHRHGQKLVDFLNSLPDDFGVGPVTLPERPQAEGEIEYYTDDWGSKWRRLIGYTTGEVVEPVLSDWSKLPELQFAASLAGALRGGACEHREHGTSLLHVGWRREPVRAAPVDSRSPQPLHGPRGGPCRTPRACRPARGLPCRGDQGLPRRRRGRLRLLG